MTGIREGDGTHCEDSKYGRVNEWMLFEEENPLLVTPYIHRSGTWNSDSYLLCLDLDALDLDLRDRSNTE